MKCKGRSEAMAGGRAANVEWVTEERGLYLGGEQDGRGGDPGKGEGRRENRTVTLEQVETEELES